MDIKEIQSLIKFVAKSGAREVKIETGDLKITIKTGAPDSDFEPTYIQQIPMGQTQMVPPVPHPVQTGEPVTADTSKGSNVEDDSKLITIKSPIIGTFYRKPSPDKDFFVEVGTVIKKGDVLCVIEAMKLFNDIESEVSGKIVKILVDDSSPVEFDQPLYLVDPS